MTYKRLIVHTHVRKHNEAIAKKLLKKKLWGQVINEYLEQLIEVEKLAK